ncbi:reverse transcriptase domain-containing protein [Wolbachia endosymbiont (group A) of Agelastica alni]|uniref:reverse transcriptase domain-containing protein n=1 Tax=Wolbachia endosymbiont (group A) of Agelastica alni TaxID=3066130 RepID=UPI0031330DC9
MVQFKEAPLLACVALHGLEQHIKKALTNELFQCMKRKYGRISHKNAQKSISVIFYCDDFIVIHESEEIILRAKVLVEEWLKTIGLELKPSKTKVSHTLKIINGIKPGFDFLGFSIRQYPTKESKKGYK